MADTLTINVRDIRYSDKVHVRIPVIGQTNPCFGYDATEDQIRQLMSIPNYEIRDAATGVIINGHNLQEYFPGGGGGGGGVTPEQVQTMIENSIDSSVSTTSINAIQNSVITNFVNSSIESSTADFKGTYTSKAAMDEVVANKNDYAFLIVENTDHSVNHYERYKWVETPVEGSNWVFEYNINNSSFTAEQWAAINSGVKDTDLTQLGTNTSDISDLKSGKVDKVEGKGLSTNDFTNEEKSQITTNKNDISSHMGSKNNPHEVTKSQVGLGNVNNTSDADKPISIATQTALDTKIDTAGTGLSKSGTTFNHSNSVTAKTSQSFAQIAYDEQGHITGSTTATTAQADAINSGINSSKVSKISTNETKINHLEQILSGSMVSRLIDFENDSTDILVGDLSRLKVYSKIGRCNLNDAGEVTAWLGDSNYSETGSNGQVMVWIPKFYYRVEPLSLEPIGNGGLGGYHLKKAIYSISDFPMAGYKLHPAFVNEAGHEIEGFFIGAFEACTFDVSENVYNITDNQLVAYTAGTGDLLASIGCTVAGDLTSGTKPTSGLSQTAATRPNFEIIANNRGTGWHSCLIKQISAVQMLMLIEGGMITKSSNAAKINSQLNFGRGVVDITDNSSYNCSSLTGSTDGNITGNAAQTYNEINGVKTAYTVDGKVSTNWRGIENLYGNIWSFVWGMNIWGDGTMRGGQPYICRDFNYAESKNSDNYEGVGFTAIPSAGYVKYFGFGKEEYDWLFVGSATGAPNDGSGMIGDYQWVTDSLNGYRIALLGGDWHGGSQAGLFCWYLHIGVGARSRAVGARLMFIPQN